MSEYNFNVKLHQGKFDVQVDTDERRGFFEHDDLGDECGGGLWFVRHASSTDGKTGLVLALYDYDGTSELPKDVASALRGAGFIVPEEFE